MALRARVSKLMPLARQTISFGRVCRLAGRGVGLFLLPQAFQHPDLPQASTDITAIGIEAQRALQIGLAPQLLAHAEQQLVSARDQEGRVADQGADLLQDATDRRPQTARRVGNARFTGAKEPLRRACRCSVS